MTTNHSIQTLDALGDGTRRQILEVLASGPKSVRELADELPVTRPAVSQHLKVLKAAHLVDDVTAGTRRIYSLCPTGFAAIRDYLDRMWSVALDAFASAANDLAGSSELGSPELGRPQPAHQKPHQKQGDQP